MPVRSGTSRHAPSPRPRPPHFSACGTPGCDGVKVVAANGWFAARPSGTEDIYKIYAESFKSESHLEAMLSEAQRLVGSALKSVKGQS
jgi:phosphoglucomutase